MLRRWTRPAGFGALLSLGAISSFAACKSDDTQPSPETDAGPTQGCDEPADPNKAVRFAPHELVVAPGESRTVRVFIEPDVCTKTSIPLSSANAGVAKV